MHCLCTQSTSGEEGGGWKILKLLNCSEFHHLLLLLDELHIVDPNGLLLHHTVTHHQSPHPTPQDLLWATPHAS